MYGLHVALPHAILMPYGVVWHSMAWYGIVWRSMECMYACMARIRDTYVRMYPGPITRVMCGVNT
jgi:hypothetical protein